MNRVIFHIDVNNAFLSWTAVKMLKEGKKIDIRTIPSVIGGNEATRHGIVLAKSPIAKKFGIKTAIPIYQAKQLCPWLEVYQGDFNTYREYSNNLYNLFLSYTPYVQRFSIDESFLDMTRVFSKIEEDLSKDYSEEKLQKELQNVYISKAEEISEKIKQTWGYTVNIGIAHNKLLAKMASDLEKPDKIHTVLSGNEMKEKLWPLPVEELLFVGKKSSIKLKKIGIKTIGDLANFDKKVLIKYFGKFGSQMHDYANGIDNSEVITIESKPKSISQEETLAKDIKDVEDIYRIVCKLTNKVTYRLRKAEMKASVISVDLRTSDFRTYSHQKKLEKPTSSTKNILEQAKKLVKEMYTGEDIRLIGVRVDKLTQLSDGEQMSFLSITDDIKQEKIDKTMDVLSKRYGERIIKRGILD